jgi:streptogramin lyase
MLIAQMPPNLASIGIEIRRNSHRSSSPTAHRKHNERHNDTLMRNPRPFRRMIAVLSSCLLALLASCGVARADRPGNPTLVATIPVSTPRDVTAGFASIWVSNGPSRTVTRINPSTGAISATITVPDPASVLAVGAGSVWLTSYPGTSLTRIDPTTNTVSRTISLAPGGLDPVGVTVFGGYVWVANHDGNPTGSVAKIDPKTMKVVDLIPVGTDSTAGPTTIMSGAGSLWVNVPNISAVVRINPSTDKTIATIPVKGACASMAANGHAVWVANLDDDGCPSGFAGISRIDTATNVATARLNAGESTGAVALDGGTVWYGTTSSNFLGRIDAATNTILGQLKLPGPPFASSTANGFVWITDSQDGLLFKAQP